MTAKAKSSPFAALPSVDRVLRAASARKLIAVYGNAAATLAVRRVIHERRRAIAAGEKPSRFMDTIVADAERHLESASRPALTRVFNLSGTTLHTNLGRAPLPPEAVDAVRNVLGPVDLEYELAAGRRGDRDDHLVDRLKRLTGADDVTVVNNNAAAVLLVLNTLALRREVVVSRGELIEIGGAFRMPDIMARAGCRLREVGTTNRTHDRDYAEAINERTAMLLRVHTSNYVVLGFTRTVPEEDVASIAHRHDLPFVVDLGSGALVDLSRWGLPHEPTVKDALAAGADLVTFSGDKLLGGPQAGIIAGRADLIARIRRNPMKRALRLDKVSIAVLDAVLRLYDDPDRLADRLPTLALLVRPLEAIRADAERARSALAAWIGAAGSVATEDTRSEIGSGAQPTRTLPSVALAIRPTGPRRGRGARLSAIAKALRSLPIPVISRTEGDAIVLDVRCLDDPGSFSEQLLSHPFAPPP